ncbi:MAG TPA: CsiV family protein [Gammaproteobacteria bacterium]|jgi:hypothetical protein
MKLIPVLAAFLLFPGSVFASRWYNVEVIIFAYTSDSGVQEEQWPLDPGAPDVANSVSLITPDDTGERLPGQMLEFETIPFNSLADPLRKLQRSSRYRVIYARAWRLPDLPSHRAPPVRIRAGKRYTPSGEIAPFVPVAGDPGSQSTMAVMDDSLYEIDGRIKISLSKFLDVDTDLLYRRYVTLPDANGLPVNEFRQFRLAEFRRMKSNTIHYLDHPLFGMVIGIDRLQTETEQDFDMPQPKQASEINQ